MYQKTFIILGGVDGDSMNKEWSNLNKEMQLKIKKKDTFDSGINTLLELRKELMNQIEEFKVSLNAEDFYAMPYMHVNGYHNKTIAYSLYHVFRIEDIVANSLIRNEQQIFFQENYKNKMNAPIITTGNELIKQEIADFSKRLNIDELYHYILEVDASTTKLLKHLSYQDLKTKMTEQDKENLEILDCVSKGETAIWLIDYWCGKDILGLIKMPFSRHWIMHIEACLRIKDKLYKK